MKECTHDKVQYGSPVGGTQLEDLYNGGIWIQCTDCYKDSWIAVDIAIDDEPLEWG